MQPNYNALRMSEQRALAKDRGLREYSELRKADLISLLRSHDASTQASKEERAQFDSEEELDKEDEVDSPSDESYQTIMEEGAQRQFDSEESDNEE